MRRIKVFFKGEAAKLKAMNFTEKRQYLWEYYKLHLGIFLVIMLVVLGLVDAWVIHPAKDSAMHIAWFAEYEEDGTFRKVTDRLTPKLVTDPEKEEVLITNYASTGDAQFDMAKAQQFQALLATGEIDAFIVGGWDNTLATVSGGYISPVDETLGLLQSADPALYERIKPTLREMEFVYEDGEDGEGDAVTGMFAIPLDGAPYVNGVDFYSKDLYFCVSVTTDKLPALVKTLQVFFGNA